MEMIFSSLTLVFPQIIGLRERQSALQDSLHRIRDHDIASQNVDERVRLEKDLYEVKDRLSRFDQTTLCSQSQSHMSAITSAGDRSAVMNKSTSIDCNLLLRLIIEILFLSNG